MMPPPQLYKYLDVRGAKLTLGNGTFRHAKPSTFNDVEDLTIQSLFPDEIEVALKILEDRQLDVILENLDRPPTCASPMKEKLIAIQYGLRNNPQAVSILRTEAAQQGSVFDLEYMRRRTQFFVDEINQFMQMYRIFCVTTHRNSEDMWTNYSDGHRGIMLRIRTDIPTDSMYQLFRPVNYVDRRPSFYQDTLGFIADALFGDQMVARTAAVDRIIYTKTLRWQHESEYRLSIPLRVGESPWETLKYYPEALTELHLGLNVTPSDKEEIVTMALRRNPRILIFQVKRDVNHELTSEPI